MSQDKDPNELFGGAEHLAVFMGDLYNCRERMRVLEAEGVESIIQGDLGESVSDLGPPLLKLHVKREDLEDVIDIFQEEWQETLSTEGLASDDSAPIDFSQETIICPGCQAELDEITEDGECPECGLFLGFPEEERDDSNDEDDEEDTDIDDDEYDVED